MNRQKKQLLLARLDKKIHSILAKKSKTWQEKDTKQVIVGLIRIIDGYGKGNDWVVETAIYKNSRLIRTWHRMSMDLSI